MLGVMTIACTGCGLPICPTVCPAELASARLELRSCPLAEHVAGARQTIRDRRTRYRTKVDAWLRVLGLPTCPPPPEPEPWPPQAPQQCFECGRHGDPIDEIPVYSCDCCDLPYCAACAYIIADDLWLCEDCNRGRCTCILATAARRSHEDVLSAVFQRAHDVHRAERREVARQAILKSRGKYPGAVAALDDVRAEDRQIEESRIQPLPVEAEIMRRWPGVYFSDGGAGRRAVLVDGPQLWDHQRPALRDTR